MKIEAIFGGVLALLVVVFAAYALANSGIGHTASAAQPTYSQAALDRHARKPKLERIGDGEDSVECQCYAAAYNRNLREDPMGAAYRNGYLTCQSQGQLPAAKAWELGWNDAGAKPTALSCDHVLRKFRR